MYKVVYIVYKVVYIVYKVVYKVYKVVYKVYKAILLYIYKIVITMTSKDSDFDNMNAVKSIEKIHRKIDAQYYTLDEYLKAMEK